MRLSTLKSPWTTAVLACHSLSYPGLQAYLTWSGMLPGNQAISLSMAGISSVLLARYCRLQVRTCLRNSDVTVCEASLERNHQCTKFFWYPLSPNKVF